MHRPAAPSAHTGQGWRRDLTAAGRTIQLAAPVRPPSRNVIAASWNGGIGPARVDSRARNAQVAIAIKPINVALCFCTLRVPNLKLVEHGHGYLARGFQPRVVPVETRPSHSALKQKRQMLRHLSEPRAVCELEFAKMILE